MKHELPPQPAHHEAIQDRLFDLDGETEQLENVYSYEILKDADQRTQFVQYTERLIADVIADKTDAVVFLDKSSRPVAWLMKSLWSQLGIDEHGEPVKQPEIRFANIDREQWGPLIGRSEDREVGIDMSRIHPDTIDSLRGLFAVKNLDHEAYAHDEPTHFDGKHIRIVDEVKSSGDTLVMAASLFSKAFPDADIRTSYWMPPKTKVLKGGARINAELPPWYKKFDPHGRLVADRDDNHSRSSVSMRQRRGALFLSTRFPYPDEEGLQLRTEMKQIAQEVRDGLIPVTPGSERSEEATEYIMTAVNHVSIDEFVRLKATAEKNHESFQKIFVDYKRARADS